MAPDKSKVVSRRNREKPVVLLALRRNRGMIRGIQDQAQAFDWDLLDVEFWGNTIPQKLKPVGAIVRCLGDDPLALQLRELGCPVVRVGFMEHPLDCQIPAVLVNMEATGRIAAEHFAERGFRDVGFVEFDPWSSAQSLYKGFCERARELHCNCHLLQIKKNLPGSTESVFEHVERRGRLITEWLSKLPKPIGVLGYHDRMAGSIIMACRFAGMAVPEEVAVLGVGNDDYCCDAAPVSLSSVDPHDEEHGRQAVLLLNRLVHHAPLLEGPVMIHPKGVVERHSTDVLAVPDPLVARAMRFMWDHLEVEMSVTDVAQELNVSRRKLERGFRTYLGRGVNAELRRKRLERCCDILRSTSLTIAEVAERVGFRSKDYLHQAFRKAYQMSPGQYRDRNRDLSEP